MSTNEEKYNSIILKIRTIQPELTQPDELTENILQAIRQPETGKAGKLIMLLRPWLSTAAMLLVGLFIYQQLEIPKAMESGKYTRRTKSFTKLDNCASQNTINSNNSESLYNCYIAYLKESESRNNKSKLFIIKYLNNF